MSENGKNILCFFVSGDAARTLGTLSDTDIINDLLAFLATFMFEGEIKVLSYIITRWHLEDYSYGSYSYLKVGSTR